LDKVEQEQEQFLRYVEQRVDLHRQNKDTKAAHLCEEWQTKVFDNVQKQIDSQLDALSPKELNRRKRDDYDAFLRTANEKAEYGLFRDIIIEEDYDPLTASTLTRAPRYSAALRDDPLKRELVQLTLPHSAKAKTRLCRDNLDPAVWSKLDSTPYGRYSSPSTRSLADSLNRLPAYRVPSSAKIHGAIDHYAIHQGNISHEFPRTKRTFPQRTNFGFAP